jgi:hypothetical protein
VSGQVVSAGAGGELARGRPAAVAAEVDGGLPHDSGPGPGDTGGHQEGGGPLGEVPGCEDSLDDLGGVVPFDFGGDHRRDLAAEVVADGAVVLGGIPHPPAREDEGGQDGDGGG